jgi:hypothetical protein
MPIDKKVIEIRPGAMDQHGRRSGGEPPYTDDGLGIRLTVLETRIETVLPTLATKGDVSEAKASIVMWAAGVVAASTAIIITVLAFLINRVSPPQSAQQAPIVVYPQQSQPMPQSPPASKRGQ